LAVDSLATQNAALREQLTEALQWSTRPAYRADFVPPGESFFALLKRGHYGIFHQLSKKHMHRYCNEFGFRWNNRTVTDGERMMAAIGGIEGKRLFYKEPIGS